MKKGDRVRLKSGGPLMTVSIVTGSFPHERETNCEWFDASGNIHSDWFDPTLLMVEST
jgi:uncharacterized protein YodC (DUF2158 family)